MLANLEVKENGCIGATIFSIHIFLIIDYLFSDASAPVSGNTSGN